MTAVTSATGTESVLGVAYGGVGAGGFYSALDPGSTRCAGKIAAATDKDLAVATVTATLADGQGVLVLHERALRRRRQRRSKRSWWRTTFRPTIDFGQAYVRFVNAISNAQPMTLYAKNTTTCGRGAHWRGRGVQGRRNICGGSRRCVRSRRAVDGCCDERRGSHRSVILGGTRLHDQFPR